MRPVEESFSIVIVGSWNHRIFSENWVAEHLAENAGSKVSLAFPIGDPNAPNRLEFEEILMFASPGNVRLTPRSQTLAGLNHCQAVAIKILQTLSHTPVSAFGINFRFQQEEGVEAIWEKVGAAPLLEDKPDLGMALTGIAITKQFEVSERAQLNHKISSPIDGAATFDFNYHHGNEDASSVLDVLKTGLVDEYYQTTKSVIRSYYDVELPE